MVARSGLPGMATRSTALALAVTLWLLVAAAPAAASTAPLSYVALGDSYTAGPLVPRLDGPPVGCLRSTYNYPHLLAAWYRISDFKDVSCSGAETGDMFAPQSVPGGKNPPQLDALSASTQYVTLQIGGNNIGFSEIARNCATVDPARTPCRDHYVTPAGDELSRRVQATAPKVAAVLAAIRSRSPEARVLVLGYPSILPEDRPGCFPIMPFSGSDAAYLQGVVVELNTMLRTVATAAGATYVDIYTPSLGRDACTGPRVRWVEPVVPAQPAAPVHPNWRGMLGFAVAVAAAVSSP